MYSKVELSEAWVAGNLLLFTVFDPIEKLWSKVKALLRKSKARTLNALPNAIQNAFHSVTVSDCSGWFRFCGYVL